MKRKKKATSSPQRCFLTIALRFPGSIHHVSALSCRSYSVRGYPILSVIIDVSIPRAPASASIAVQSPDIAHITLHRRIPVEYHLYSLPFLVLYPIWAYGYFISYDTWFKSEEWTFVFTVGLIASHALSFLVTRWSVAAKALITCTKVSYLPQLCCMHMR